MRTAIATAARPIILIVVDIQISPQSGIANMYLVIHQARNQILAARIEDLKVFLGGDSRADLVDALTFDENVGVANLAFVDQARIAYE